MAEARGDTPNNSPHDAEKRLAPKQMQAALLLAQGTTIAKTADSVGVSEKSVDLWKRKPEFLQAIHQAEDEIYLDALRLLKRTAKAAVMTLVACLDPKVSAYVRVQAASELLKQSIEVHRTEELEARILALEEQVKAGTFDE